MKKKTLSLIIGLIIVALVLLGISDTLGILNNAPAVSTAIPEAGSTCTITDETSPAQTNTIVKDGEYTTAEDIALCIHTFGHLPSSFITKSEARELGWEGGLLEPYAPGKCIGGERFGNYEGLLPEKYGRFYIECDIGTMGASSRGAKRIVFQMKGLSTLQTTLTRASVCSMETKMRSITLDCMRMTSRAAMHTCLKEMLALPS